ncbi:Uncharacterised protein [Chlamydia abortus]|nr:Uncharacterised protein [Chlamydia abortus]
MSGALIFRGVFVGAGAGTDTADAEAGIPEVALAREASGCFAVTTAAAAGAVVVIGS